MKLILKFIFSAVAVMLISYLLPGVQIQGFSTALAVAVVLGLCNLILKPILIFLTLPITILTLGLFLLVINIIMIYVTDMLIPGFQIASFFDVVLFGILLAVFNSITTRLIEKDD